MRMLISHRPVLPLAAHVESLWYYHGFAEAGHQERVLPNGKFQVVIDINSGRGAVSGMRSQYVVIDPAAIRSAIGIVFRPGGTCGFLEGPAEDYFNQAVPLDLVWGPQLGRLHDRLHVAITPEEKFQVIEKALHEMVQASESRLS